MASELLEIFEQLITLFLIIAVGYAAKKTHLMDERFDRGLSKVILNAALPSMIIGSVLTAETLPTLSDILMTFLVSCAGYAVTVLIAYLFTAVMRISVGHRGVFRFMLCFGNVGFIGFPVLSAIYGSDALIYATVFNLPFNFLVFTMGAWFLTQDNDEGVKVKTTWKTFLSPAIISCVIAIALTLLGVHNVPVAGSAFETLGSLTTPAALLIIGSSLADMPLRELIGGFRMWMACLFRLLVIPFAVWGIFHFFVTNPLLLGVIVVISGMPVATNGTMLCYQYGGNTHDMAQGTFLSTVLSTISIPVLVAFLSFVA